MHAPPPAAPQVGPGAALALVASFLVLLAGCSAASTDQAALQGPSTTVSSVAAMAGPAVTFSGDAPGVAGHPGATATLGAVAAGLAPGCAPTLERADTHLVSVLWRCGSRLSAATVTLDGRRLALSDILRGGYASYLSSVAAEQFAAQGQPGVAGDLGNWYLTPASLAVAFPAGMVSYPLFSLGAYIADPSGL